MVNLKGELLVEELAQQVVVVLRVAERREVAVSERVEVVMVGRNGRGNVPRIGEIDTTATAVTVGGVKVFELHRHFGSDGRC